MSERKTVVAARDESQPNSPISNADDDTLTIDENAKCLWNGQEFADGDSVCAADQHYVCSYGNWLKVSAGKVS